MRSILLLTLAVTGLIYQFYSFPYGEYFLPFLTAVTIVAAIPHMSKIPKISSIVMLVLGHAILVLEGGIGYQAWSEAFIGMLPVASLFLFVPLLQIPVNLGGHTKYIEHFARHQLKSPGRFYFVTGIIYFLLAPFLNLSVHRLYYEMIEKVPLSKKTVVLSMQRCFVSTVIWAPYFIAMGIVSTYVSFNITDIFLPAFLLGLVQLAVSYVVFRLDIKNENFSSVEYALTGEDKRAAKKIFFLGIWIALLMVSIIPLEMILRKRMIVVVSAAAVIQSLLWSLLIGGLKPYFRELVPYFKERGLLVINEVVFFLSAGFFAKMLNHSQAGNWIANIALLTHNFLLPLTIFLIMSFIILLGAIGVHQMIPIAAIASAVPAGSLGLSAGIYAMLFTFTWGIAALASPFSPLNVVISNVADLSPVKVGPVWNGKVTFILMAVMSLLLYALQMLIY